MKPWLTRGLGLTLTHVLVRVLLGAALVQWPLQGTVLRWGGLLAVVFVALLWGGIDGIHDRRANPDPDRGADLTMLWLKAGAVAGLLGGFLTWLVDAITPIPVGVKSLFFEITSGAAFTVLLVFLPAMLAVTVGRFLVRREQAKPVEQPAPAPVPVGAAAGANTAWSSDDSPTEVFPAVDPQRDDRR
ncbi:B-4DMT family transporter [Rhodococcus zopfii]|uniref:B-4DMT family transporter n=1 Tax=Rhodococcus zopfii TaxID=43772 RepID=UPI00365E97EA